jgi:hypothetical protein
VADASWFELSEDKKEEVLKNMITIGKEKGFTSVHLLSKEGKTVGYISARNITQTNSN